MHDIPQLLNIAHQCPAADGEAVFRARVMLSIVNDSLVYDDVTACLQVGIYREIKKAEPAFYFELVPNPANDQLMLRILNEQMGFCEFKILNVLGKAVFESKIDCEKSEHIIPTHQLMPGTYLVKIRFGDFEKVEKLLIIR